MTAEQAVHVVVPEGIDDPARPSGGNVYDRQVCHGLRALGWSVTEHAVPGSWPRPDGTARAALAAVVGGIPDRSVVLLDGLVASSAPDVLVPQSFRLRIVVLVHMPLGEASASGPRAPDAAVQEQAVLSAAAAVLTPSRWTRRRLLDQYSLTPDRVHVAEPGVATADPASGSADGGELLCVAAVTPVKGHDLLVAALAAVADLQWGCTCVGSLDRDPAFAASVRTRAARAGIGDRMRFTGPQTGADLDAAYAAADLLVVASRAETYGLVVLEALARGLPVVASAVGGLPEALGRGTDGRVPGRLVPACDPAALGAALRDWLGDPLLRHQARETALDRRAWLPGWRMTTAVVAGVLTTAAGASR